MARKEYMDSFSLLVKSKKLLLLLLLAFSLILLRVWHLSLIQSEDKVRRKMPTKKHTIIHPAPRGEIFDRYHLPLAINKIRYDANIYYNQIKEIPSFIWVKGKGQKKYKKYLRKEYIHSISTLLSNVLDLDQDRIEDLIHSKASLFPNTPYTLKENLTESEYYKLKMLEKDYPGLSASSSLVRDYPKKKVGSNLLGYLGAISQNEYLKVAQKISLLEKFLEEEESLQSPSLPDGYFSKEHVIAHLKKLKECSYTLSTMVGKVGIEKKQEEILRGFYGKTSYETDIFGRFLHKLPDEKKPLPGRQIELTISSELQEFAENLLALNEKIRDGKSVQYSSKEKKMVVQKQPWIKGGAIVALNPNNGQVLAMASYPRLDSNDFIPSSKKEVAAKKRQNVRKWLETPSFIGNLWDGKTLLTREIYSEKENKIYQESEKVDWPYFIKSILPESGKIVDSFSRIHTIKEAIELQEAFEFISYFTLSPLPSHLIDALYPSTDGYQVVQPKDLEENLQILEKIELNYKNIFPHKKTLNRVFKNLPCNLDKLFLIDVCRVCIYSPAFSNQLIDRIGSLSLEEYRTLTQAFLTIEDLCKEKLKQPFQKQVFSLWRKENEKSFLKEMRLKEKKNNSYARPYIDYLDQEENLMFSHFWSKLRGLFFLHLIDPEFTDEKIESFIPFLQIQSFSKETTALLEMFKNLYLEKDEYLELFATFRCFSQLARPLLAKYPRIYGSLEKDLASSFYPSERFGYSRSYAFCQSAPLGSIFKVITAYSALKVLYKKNPQDLDPFQFFDTVRFDPKVKKKGSLVVGYLDNKVPIPRFYKGGRMPKSHSSYIGQLNLDSALEQTSNPYFALLATEILEDPEDLALSAAEFGFGEKSGIDLPLEYSGNLPTDLHQNKTGLYSFSIGQHTLLVTPLQTALMLSAIANGGTLYKPQIIQSIIGEERLNSLTKPLCLQSYAFKDLLENVGIDYSLFTGKEHNQKETLYCESPTQIRRKIDLPKEVQEKILKGMQLVVNGEKGTARGNNARYIRERPHLGKQYEAIKKSLAGKTSTAEICYNLNANPSSKSELYKHIWFGAISYEEGKPDLVVVVYLRFGDWGKEAAPLAGQIIDKYREIKRTHLK